MHARLLAKILKGQLRPGNRDRRTRRKRLVGSYGPVKHLRLPRQKKVKRKTLKGPMSLMTRDKSAAFQQLEL